MIIAILFYFTLKFFFVTASDNFLLLVVKVRSL